MSNRPTPRNPPTPPEIARSIQVVRQFRSARETALQIRGATFDAIAADPTVEGLRTALAMIDLAGEQLLLASKRASAGADKWERLTELDEHERHVWRTAFASAIVQLYLERATQSKAAPDAELPGKARVLADFAVDAYRREVGR